LTRQTHCGLASNHITTEERTNRENRNALSFSVGLFMMLHQNGIGINDTLLSKLEFENLFFKEV
jgi:hypothetical protein